MNKFNVNYNDCIVNLSNSILKRFNVKTMAGTISDIDRDINNYRNVVVILYDGMGYNLINRILPKDSFLVNNMVRSISSVIPATTTASTTSMLSGMYPNSHGWLGWNLYFSKENKIVTMFTNCLKDSSEKASESSLAYKYYDYKDIGELIKESGINTKLLFPFPGRNYEVYSDLNDMNDKIVNECNKSGRNFIYAYYTDPDAVMHEFGCDSKECFDTFNMINKSTEDLCNRLNDTLVIVTADHGHMNCDYIMLSDYPDIINCLRDDISIEGRLCSFMVKNDKNEEFVSLFNKYFSDDFMLLSKEEVIKINLFGITSNHPLFLDSLGDFIAIAKTDKYFISSEKCNIFKSVHAGISDDEMKIPLIMVKKR